MVAVLLNHEPRVEGGGSIEASARAFHASLPGYRRTGLLPLPTLAEGLDVGLVTVKDETERFGLPAFKALGASWAVLQTVASFHDPSMSSVPPTLPELSRFGPYRLVAATDGNHGRAVAWMARLLGWSAHVLVPAGTADARIAAIISEGAEVEVVDGSYDDAVRRSAAMAGDGDLVISDTAWEGYDQPARWVIEGYSTIFSELDDQVHEHDLPPVDAVVVQLGVGALGTAVITWARSRQPRVRVLGVEPTTAACVTASIRAGHPVEVPGPHRSLMAGLNCGNVSPIAWPVLSAGLDACATIDDDELEPAMLALADAGLVVGESGAAGLAGLVAALRGAHADELRTRLGLDPSSHVAVLATEGATDPVSYQEIVGRSVDDVRADHPEGMHT